MKEEICEQCGAIIGIDEQAYVYNGCIVCGQCDQMLHRQAQQDRLLQDTSNLEQLPPFPDTEELNEIQSPKETPELTEPDELFEIEQLPLNEQVTKEKENIESLEVFDTEKESEVLPETEEPRDANVHQEFEQLKEPEEISQIRESGQIQESEKTFESIETPETEDFSEFQEFEFPEEPKADELVTESRKPFESLDNGGAEDFAQFHEFEEPPKPKEHQEVKESGKLFKTLRMDEPDEFERFSHAEEIEEYEKPEKLRDLIEPPAAPFIAEQVASVRLSGKRRRIKRTKSTLLCFLLTVWSLLCLFLLFYVPGQYADLLRDTAFCKRYQLGGFAPDCLILSLMAIWFFGALLLFVIVTSLQKDRHRAINS